MLDITMKPSKLWLRNPKDLISPLSKSTEELSEIETTIKDEPNDSSSPPSMISVTEDCIPPCSRNPSVIRKNTQVCGDSDLVPFKRQDSEPLPKKRRLLDVRDHNDNHEEELSPSSTEITQNGNNSSDSDDAKSESFNETTVEKKENKTENSENCKSPNVLPFEKEEKCHEISHENNTEPIAQESIGVIKTLVKDETEKLNDSDHVSDDADANFFQSAETKKHTITAKERNDDKADQVLPDSAETTPLQTSPPTTPTPLSNNPVSNGEISEKISSPSVIENANLQVDTTLPKSIINNRKDLENSIDEFQDILAKACHAVGLDEGPMDISDIVDDTNFSYPFINYDAANAAGDAYHKEHVDMRMPYYPPPYNKDITYQPRIPNYKNNRYFPPPPVPQIPPNAYASTQNATMYRGNSPYPHQKQTRLHFSYHVPYQEQLVPQQAYQYSTECHPKPQPYPYSDPYYYYRYPQHPNQFQQRPNIQMPQTQNNFSWPNENYSNNRMDLKQMHYYYRYPQVRPPAMPSTHFPYTDTSANFKPCRYDSYPQNIRQRNHYSYNSKHPAMPGLPQNSAPMNGSGYFSNQTSAQQIRTVRSSSISPQEYSSQRSGYSPIRSPITPVVFNNPQASMVTRIPTTVHDNNEKSLSSSFPVAPVPTKYGDVTESKTTTSSHKSNQNANNKHMASFEHSISSCNTTNYEKNSRIQGPFIIEKVRQYSYPPGYYSDWKVPTYDANSDNSKNPNQMSNGIRPGANCLSKTAPYLNTVNNNSLGSHSNNHTKTAVNDKNIEFRFNHSSNNYPVNCMSQIYPGHDKCPPSAQFSGPQKNIESCKVRKLQENRQIITSKSQTITNKKSPPKDNLSSIANSQMDLNTMTSKHNLSTTNIPKSYPSYNSGYKVDYNEKFHNSSDNSHNYYHSTQENNHIHCNVANYNDNSSTLYKNTNNNYHGSTIASREENNPKNANEYSPMQNLSTLPKSSINSSVSNIKLNISNQNPEYSCNQNSSDFEEKRDLTKSPILNRTLQSNHELEFANATRREKQDSQEKEPKRRSHSLPSEITIGPFILNKGYATFANTRDDDCDMILFKQKLLPVIDHLLSIPEAANLRPLRDNPDELLDHLVKMWGGNGANSMALDAHQRMKENFVSVVKFLFKPHLLSLWGWDKAPPEQILDELLNTSEQGQLLSQLTLGDFGHQNNTTIPTRTSSVDDDEVFLPSTFSCNDIPEDVFKYFDIIDTTSAPDNDFKESATESSDTLRNIRNITPCIYKTSCSNKSESSSQRHRQDDKFGLESSIDNCTTLLMDNDASRTEIHPNLESVEDLIPSILEENMIGTEEWKSNSIQQTNTNFDSSSYNVEKNHQGKYVENEGSNIEEHFSDSLQELPEKPRTGQFMPLIESNELDATSTVNADNPCITDETKLNEGESRPESNITEWDKLAEHLIDFKNQYKLNERNYKLSNDFENENERVSPSYDGSSKFEENCSNSLSSSSAYSIRKQVITEENPDKGSESLFSQNSMDSEDMENITEGCDEKIIPPISMVDQESSSENMEVDAKQNSSDKSEEKSLTVNLTSQLSNLSPEDKRSPATCDADKIHEHATILKSSEPDCDLHNINESKALETTLPTGNQSPDNPVVIIPNKILQVVNSEDNNSNLDEDPEDAKPSCNEIIDKSLNQENNERENLKSVKENQDNAEDTKGTIDVQAASECKRDDENRNLSANSKQKEENPSKNISKKNQKEKFRLRKIYPPKIVTLKRQVPVTDYTAIFQKYVESKMLLTNGDVTKANKSNTNIGYNSV